MISHKILKRFLLYRLCLIKFQRLGFTRIFSYTLGNEASVKAEQVRKDFSVAGIKGSRRGGYEIEYLLTSINKLFKLDGDRLVVLVGIGNIGQALINYVGFKENKIKIIAGFDLDPSKYTRKNIIPIYHPDQLPEIVQKYSITTAIMAVPEAAGQEICDKLVSAGIRGILNFSPVILQVPEYVVVNYVNIRNELESLFYFT
ncbi:MAG TPA: redox-sensing transcriptional repressor Rex [Bacteroidales bacterium]|nr:redox-sensing transcriptional repressor Rex [Bacteroidales bacterium]